MLAELSSVPEKPLVAGLGKIEETHPTFFYERPDGSVIFVNEREAWTIHKKFKQIGVSDGTIFQKHLIESKEIFSREGLASAQAHIRKGEKAELEAARGHFQLPRNFDCIDTSGNPVYPDGMPMPPNRRT